MSATANRLRASARASIAALALVLLAAAGAQDAGPAPAAADKAAAEPRPSEIAPMAVLSLLLRVVDTGKQLVAVGERGHILLSADGEQWSQVRSPVSASLTAACFSDADHGWAVGHDAAILRTVDAGHTWTLQHFDPEAHQPLLDVLCLDQQRAYAVGAFGSFFVTRDGGASWTPADAPAIRADGPHLNAIVKLNNGELFIAGESGLLGVSADGGAWEKLKSSYEGSYFGAMPWSDKGVIVYGQRGNVWRSDDVHSGVWTRLDLGTTQSVFGGTLLPQGGAALVGADGLAVLLGADGALDRRKLSRVSGGSDSGTLASVIARKDGLLAVGEFGVERWRIAP